MLKLIGIFIVIFVINFNLIFSKVTPKGYVDVIYTEKQGDHDVSEDYDRQRRYILTSQFQSATDSARTPMFVANRMYAILDGTPAGEEFPDPETNILKSNAGIVAPGNGKFNNTSNTLSSIVFSTNVGQTVYIFTYDNVVWYCHERVENVQASSVLVVGAGTEFDTATAGSRIGRTTDNSTLQIHRSSDAGLEIIDLATYYSDVREFTGSNEDNE